MNEYMNEYMKETNEALLHTYNQFPVVLDHGEGAYLYDTEGKKYLDFAAGYAVSSLGYANEELNTALKAFTHLICITILYVEKQQKI